MDELKPIAVDTTQACRMIGVSLSTLSKALKNGDLPFSQIGRKRIIRVSDLEEWVERKKHND